MQNQQARELVSVRKTSHKNNKGGRTSVGVYVPCIYSHTGRAQELCESRGGRPGLPVPNKPTVSVGRKATLNQRIPDESYRR